MAKKASSGNLEGQLKTIDELIDAQKDWSKSLLSLVKDYNKFNPEYDKVDGWVDEKGYPISEDYFEEALNLLNIDNPDNKAIPVSEEFILAEFKEPQSEELRRLQKQLFEAAFPQSLIDHPFYQNQWLYYTDEPERMGGLIVDYAKKAANELQNNNTRKLQNLRDAWEREGMILMQDNKGIKNWDAGVFSKIMVNIAYRTLSSLQISNNSRRTTSLLDVLASKMLKGIDRAYMVPGLEDNNIKELESQVDELKSILSQAQSTSVRGRARQNLHQHDAMHLMQIMAKYWSSVYSTWNALDESTKSQIRMAGAPSYRYAIGAMVKIKNSGRTGKIVGIRREGGTGRQVYEVRMVNSDRTKLYGLRDLMRTR